MSSHYYYYAKFEIDRKNGKLPKNKWKRCMDLINEENTINIVVKLMRKKTYNPTNENHLKIGKIIMKQKQNKNKRLYARMYKKKNLS